MECLSFLLYLGWSSFFASSRFCESLIGKYNFSSMKLLYCDSDFSVNFPCLLRILLKTVFLLTLLVQRCSA